MVSWSLKNIPWQNVENIERNSIIVDLNSTVHISNVLHWLLTAKFIYSTAVPVSNTPAQSVLFTWPFLAFCDSTHFIMGRREKCTVLMQILLQFYIYSQGMVRRCCHFTANFLKFYTFYHDLCHVNVISEWEWLTESIAQRALRARSVLRPWLLQVWIAGKLV